MQLTGASAPGAAASPESGVSPLTDTYTKMTSDILAQRTLDDYVASTLANWSEQVSFPLFYSSAKKALLGSPLDLDAEEDLGNCHSGFLGV